MIRIPDRPDIAVSLSGVQIIHHYKTEVTVKAGLDVLDDAKMGGGVKAESYR